MAHYNHGQTESLKAASAIAQYVPVSFLAGGSALDETVIRTGSSNELPVGMTIATIASVADPAAVVVSGRAKGIAAASLGAGALVAVGSTNGVLIPIAASGQLASAGPSAGIFVPRYSVGRAVQNAVAGDVFTVLVDPQQVV